eukprot:9949688-Alexandrium_andersonii.AAC.1
MGGRGPSSPNGPTALSAARNLQKFSAPLSRGGRRRRRAPPNISADLRAAERAIWLVGRAGTAASHRGLGGKISNFD